MSDIQEWDDTDDATDVVIAQNATPGAELSSSADSEGAEPEPQTYFGSVDEFVREKLVVSYRRLVGPQAPYRWAGDWWSYPEAISRLDGIWRAWEHLRLDAAAGSAIWWRDFCDPHMRALLDPQGPFMASHDSNEIGEPLPYLSPPAGLFPDERSS